MVPVRRPFVIALLASCLFSCSSTLPPAATSVAGVYAAVLHRYVAPGAVIQSATTSPPPESRQPLPAGPPAELLAEFRRIAWGPPAPLNPGVKLPAGSVTVTPARLSAFSAQGGFWPEFNRAFPGANGLVGFSRVAFVPQRGEALVYFTHGRAEIVGGGSLILLRWKNAAWHVTATYQLWVS